MDCVIDLGSSEHSSNSSESDVIMMAENKFMDTDLAMNFEKNQPAKKKSSNVNVGRRKNKSSF